LIKKDFDENAETMKKKEGELLRQIWAATEVDDMMSCHKILK